MSLICFTCNHGISRLTVPLTLTMKLCSTLLIVSGRNFYKKRQIRVSEPYFGEVRGDARPWLMDRWKVHGRLSLRINWTLLLSITFLELGYVAKCVQLGCFRNTGRPLCTQILAGQGRPHQPVLTSETLRQLMVKTVFICVPSFWHNTGVWQTDRYPRAYTALCDTL